MQSQQNASCECDEKKNASRDCGDEISKLLSMYSAPVKQRIQRSSLAKVQFSSKPGCNLDTTLPVLPAPEKYKRKAKMISFKVDSSRKDVITANDVAAYRPEVNSYDYNLMKLMEPDLNDSHGSTSSGDQIFFDFK